MANVKISALSALSGSSVAIDDVLCIVDTSAGSTKKIRIDELITALTALGPVDVEIEVFAPGDAVTVNDNVVHFWVPLAANGKNLTSVKAFVCTASSSGLPTIQVRKITGNVDMLSTACTIDVNELSSVTAATPAVIDTGHDDVATNDELSIDVDVAGTGTTGLSVVLRFA